MKKLVLVFLVVATALCACKKSGSGDVPSPEPSGDYVAPEPPATVVEDNVFYVDFFTDLSNSPYFALRDTDAAVNYITGMTGKRPLFYMFDRSDFTVGQSLPHVNIAYKSKYLAHFAQNKPSASKIEGTGVVTKYIIGKVDGIAEPDTMFMSGYTLTAPLATSVTLTVYTCRIDSLGQIMSLVRRKGAELNANGCVVGTIASGITAQTAEYLKKNFKNFRLQFYGDATTAYSLMVFTPVWYVCRGAEQGATVNLPYYRISIEKLDSTVKL